MKFIKKYNIYKGITSLCIIYAIFISFFSLQVYSKGESFNWSGYILLFPFIVITYFASLPFINAYLKRKADL